MSTRLLRLWLAAGLSCLGLCPMGCEASDADSDAPPVEAWVWVADQRIGVELAESAEEQALGLGGRDGLDWDRGMLFTYERPLFYRFWMKDMRFDIDIVWIREGRIVDLLHRVPHQPDTPEGTLRRYRPMELADSVLEVPAGYAQAHGWRVGDRVRVERVAD